MSPRENELITVFVTMGPAFLPANLTLIRTAPVFTDHPSLTASIGSMKVVDAPVSIRSLMGRAGQRSSAGIGTDCKVLMDKTFTE